MRSTRWLVLGLLLVGCGDDTSPTNTPDAPSIDAPRPPDAAIDAAIDAPAIDAPANPDGANPDGLMADAMADAQTICFGTSTSCGPNPASCTDCSGSATGHACVDNATGTCGCRATADCPLFKACDTTTHSCVNACSATQLCNGGCCAGNSCITGSSDPGQCGNGGGACQQCAGTTTGHICIGTTNGGFCGCTDNPNCPAGHTCNTSTNMCN